MSQQKIKRTPSARVMAEFARQNRGWKQMGCTQFHPTMDINVPPAYIAEVQGQRNDGVVFRKTIALNKAKIDLIASPFVAMQVARDAIVTALLGMNEYLECSCTLETSCEQHRTN